MFLSSIKHLFNLEKGSQHMYLGLVCCVKTVDLYIHVVSVWIRHFCLLLFALLGYIIIFLYIALLP